MTTAAELRALGDRLWEKGDKAGSSEAHRQASKIESDSDEERYQRLRSIAVDLRTLAARLSREFE